jgi:undecaprenyl-diphosphatase
MDLDAIIPFLDKFDKDLLLYLNGLYHSSLDPIMWEMTGKRIWLPLFALAIWGFWKEKNWLFWLPLVFIALALTISDQIASSLMKPFFERFRPSHSPEIGHLIRLYEGYKGGKYGFVSAHAATSFATAVFVFQFFKTTTRRWIGFLYLAWAVLFSYTRIYLGVHYLGDILGGALLGTLTAFFCFWLFQKAAHFQELRYQSQKK